MSKIKDLNKFKEEKFYKDMTDRMHRLVSITYKDLAVIEKSLIELSDNKFFMKRYSKDVIEKLELLVKHLKRGT